MSLFQEEQPAGEIFRATQKLEKQANRQKKSSTESIPKKTTSRLSLDLHRRPSPGLFYWSSSHNPEKYTPGVGRNQMGGTCAAPAFRSIGLRTLKYLGIPEDDPKNDALDKEVKDLKVLFDKWNHG